ncbi:MAG: hypothetical protein ACO1RX_23605 [Candidatus Sericytochromatia bacterium]
MPSPSPALLKRLAEIYLAGDTAAYEAACARPFELPDPLQMVLEEAVFWLEPDTPLIETHWPSVSFTLVAPSFIEGNFQVDYRMRLDVSKLYPAYRLSFDYEIANPDPDALKSSFWGFSEQPHTQAQMRFLDAWELTAQSLGWERLSENLGQQPLRHFLEAASAFPEESLWRHLVFDLLELCPD